jgi:hypothetical protein
VAAEADVSAAPAPPGLEHVCDLAVQVAAPLSIGDTGAGVRRVVDILGGRVDGPLLNGRIRPGGADFQIIRPDGAAALHARYVIEEASGALVYVENTGIRAGPAEALARLNRGEPVDPALIYFRSAPRFETSAPNLRWLMDHLFVATGVRRPDAVELSVFVVR